MYIRILAGLFAALLWSGSANAVTLNLVGQGETGVGNIVDVALSLDIDETVSSTGFLSSTRTFSDAVLSGRVTVDGQTESFTPTSPNAITARRTSNSTVFISLAGTGFDHTLFFGAFGLFSPADVNDLGAFLPDVASAVNAGIVAFGGSAIDPTFSGEIRNLDFTSASVTSGISAVPLPAPLPLLAAGLLAMVLVRRRRRSAPKP